MQTQHPEPNRRLEYRVFPAVLVIAIGVLFLLRNLGVDVWFLYRGNWWAWLILLAALAPLTRAIELYRTRDCIDSDVIHHVLAATGIAIVAILFLLGLDWDVWWPLFVILGGCFALVHRRRVSDHTCQ